MLASDGRNEGDAHSREVPVRAQVLEPLQREVRMLRQTPSSAVRATQGTAGIEQSKAGRRTSLRSMLMSAGATFTACRTRTNADAKSSVFGSAAKGAARFGMSCTHTVWASRTDQRVRDG